MCVCLCVCLCVCVCVCVCVKITILRQYVENTHLSKKVAYLFMQWDRTPNIRSIPEYKCMKIRERGKNHVT